MGSDHKHVVTFSGERYAKLNKITNEWDLFGKNNAYLGSAKSIHEVEKLNKDTE